MSDYPSQTEIDAIRRERNAAIDKLEMQSNYILKQSKTLENVQAKFTAAKERIAQLEKECLGRKMNNAILSEDAASNVRRLHAAQQRITQLEQRILEMEKDGWRIKYADTMFKLEQRERGLREAVDLVLDKWSDLRAGSRQPMSHYLKDPSNELRLFEMVVSLNNLDKQLKSLTVPKKETK